MLSVPYSQTPMLSLSARNNQPRSMSFNSESETMPAAGKKTGLQ